MSRWFRLYDDVLDDPKVQLLSPELFRTWVNLLALASRNNGVLPAMAQIAFALRSSAQDVQAKLDDLILAGLIDIRPDGRMEPHNWASRQHASDSSTERMRKHREKRKVGVGCDATGDVTEAVTVTPSESESETDLHFTSPSEQDAARARSEVVKDLLRNGSAGASAPKGDLVRRAEGLGLPVEDMLATLRRTRPRNASAYFRTLCVSELARRLPRCSPDLLSAALSGKPEAAGVVMAALMESAT